MNKRNTAGDIVRRLKVIRKERVSLKFSKVAQIQEIIEVRAIWRIKNDLGKDHYLNLQFFLSLQNHRHIGHKL